MRSALERLGLLNYDADDYGELASSVPKRTVPYCTSGICCKNGRSRVRKTFVGRPERCIDCGYYLVYAPERARRGAVEQFT